MRSDLARAAVALAFGVAALTATAAPITDEGRASLEQIDADIDRATALERPRRLADAIAALEQILKESPRDAGAMTLLARALQARSPYADSRRVQALLEDAIEIDPALVEARTGKALFALRGGCAPCADEALAAARQIDPGHPGVHAVQAAVHWSRLRSREWNPGGKDYVEAGRDLLDRTVDELQAAIAAEKRPRKRASLEAWRADLLLSTGRRDEAYAALRRAVAADPENPAALRRYAWSLAYDQGRVEDAAEMVQGALDDTNESSRRIVALGAYARWAKAWQSAATEASTRALLDAAREKHPDAEEVFQYAVASEKTAYVAKAMLAAKVYRVSPAEYRDRDGDTALANAVLNAGKQLGDETRRMPDPVMEVVAVLIGEGANVNAWVSRGREPVLATAARMGDARLVQALVAAGANPHAGGADGTTPLLAAAQGTDPRAAIEITTLLLARGARPEPRDYYGQTALMAAARTGNDDLVRLLLERKVAVEAVDRDEQNALDWAVSEGHVEVVETLLAAGAETTRIVGSCGVVTTYDRAHGNPRILELLRKHQKSAS